MHLVQALSKLRQGDTTDARSLLTKALKYAHAGLGNTQMVSQVGSAASTTRRVGSDQNGSPSLKAWRRAM